MNFDRSSYTVAEGDGQVSLHLRIEGQFFIPLWALVNISDGTATGGLCKYIGMNNESLQTPHEQHSQSSDQRSITVCLSRDDWSLHFLFLLKLHTNV